MTTSPGLARRVFKSSEGLTVVGFSQFQRQSRGGYVEVDHHTGTVGCDRTAHSKQASEPARYSYCISRPSDRGVRLQVGHGKRRHARILADVTEGGERPIERPRVVKYAPAVADGSSAWWVCSKWSE
eukprot:scaffold36138_cov48-Prasinocladus_malaysianus.AAC.1